MSKFCGNCGATLDDNAKVCGNCGTPLESAGNSVASTIGNVASNVAGNVANVVTPENKEKAKGAVKKFAPIAAIVAVVAIILAVIFGGNSYKSVVKKYVKAIKKENAKAVVKMISPTFKNAYIKATDSDKKEFEEDAIEYYKDSFKKLNDYFEDELDSDKYKISYKIKDVDDADKDDVKDAKDAFKDEGYKWKISKMKNVEVKITAKKGSNDEDVTRNLIIVKEGMKWYIVPTFMLFGLGLD